MQDIVSLRNWSTSGGFFTSILVYRCVWVAEALKSRLPRCVPPCLVAFLVAIQLGVCVGRTWGNTGYEPKCGHCAALMPAGNASCRCGEAGRSAVCRACSTKKLEGESLPQKAGDARRLRKRGADAVHQREVWLLKFGEAPNSWCGGSSPTASARLHTLHSACLSCRVGGVRVSSWSP